MAGRKSRPVRRSRRSRFRRSRRGSSGIALVPAILGGAAVGSLFTTTDPNGFNVISDIMTAQETNGSTLQYIPYHILNGVKSPDFWVTLGAAIATGWAGQKFGLHHKTRITKKLSVL